MERMVQAKSNTGKYAADARSNLLLRTCTVLLLLTLLHLVVLIGPVGLMMAASLLLTVGYIELISIYFQSNNIHVTSLYSFLAFYYYLVTNYFYFGSFLLLRYACIDQACNILFEYYLPYHNFTSFTLYLIGFIYFIKKLTKDNVKSLISFYSYLHTVFVLVFTPVYLAVQNMMYGLFWLIFPIIIVGANDLLAYVFGKTLGRTSLFLLSPKKTLEGYIGAGLATLLLGHVLASYVDNFEHFMCPINILGETTADSLKSGTEMTNSCIYSEDVGTASAIRSQNYIHILVLTIFAAIFAPFGGFFASGFKRAFGIKNFSTIIPGHGGILDRFDCQILMIIFVNVYAGSFIRNENKELQLYTAHRQHTHTHN